MFPCTAKAPHIGLRLGLAISTLLFSRCLTAQATPIYTSTMANADPGDTSDYGSYWTGSASASADLLASDLLHANASAITVSRFDKGHQVEAIAQAGWADIVHYTGAVPPPTLSFHFGITGSLYANPALGDGNPFVNPGNPLGGGTAAFFINKTDIFSMPDQVATVYDGYIHGVLTGQYGVGASHVENFQTGIPDISIGAGFDSVQDKGNGERFDATFHFDFNYNPALDGYSPGIVLTAFAQSRSVSGNYEVSIGQSLFGDTATLDSISLPDGTPVDLNNLQFGSGLQFGPSVAAAPEPSSIISLGIGLTNLLGFGIMRRNLGRKKKT
jgi:hypothetical protein